MLRNRHLASLGVALPLAITSMLSACRAEDPARTPANQAQSHAEIHPKVDTPTSTATVAGPDEPPLTREEVRLVVRSKMQAVRTCFGEALTQDANAGGRVVLRFTITGEGRASAVEVVEDEVGAGAASCLVEALGSWQFPRPREGRAMTLNYPFVFSSEQSLRDAGLPRVEGTVKPKALGEVFDARRAELDECLPTGATGKVALAFLLDERGQVTKLSIVETSLQQPVAACVGRAVSSWGFPAAAPGDEARVNHELQW